MYRIFNVKKAACISLAALILLLLPTVIIGVVQLSKTVGNTALREKPVIVVDAGHGGVDPGAIGVNGAKEKEINLSIALYLQDILEVNGWDVILTREEDVSLNDPEYTKISAMKTSDLKNRLKLIEESDCILAISIHQNQFTQSKYQGAQMFYGRNHAESQRLAESMQQAFREQLQPENTREVKRSTSDVYIIHNAQKPIVLAECGFLSNEEECSLLCTEEYQKKVAFTLFCGIMQYISQQEEAG